MDILVLDIAASKTGALSVLKDFYGYLVSRPAGEEHWTFVTGVPGIIEPIPEKDIDVITREDVKASSASRLRFELVNGGAWINDLSPDVVFSLENMLPRGIKQDIKQVLYIHQPVGFQHLKKFSLLKKNEREQALYQKFYHPLIISSAKRASSCVVQTEWMRRALIKELHGGGDKVHKLLPDMPDLSAYVNQGEFDRRRFFYPASDLPYKNHALVEKACDILKSGGYEPEIIFTKDRVIPREEVFAEYNRSTLVFPSYIETYGMPLGEAQQFGNPILAADTDFAREVLKGCPDAHFFDPFDAKALAGLMRDVMDKKIAPSGKGGSSHSSYGHTDSNEKLVNIILS